MDFKNAVKALQIGKKEGKKFRLSTEFGKNPEEELPFPEYPRPQMRRENWTNLNGWWEYAFTETQKMPLLFMVEHVHKCMKVMLIGQLLKRLKKQLVFLLLEMVILEV